jgi:type 1 glutamine amidotransferase
MMRWTLVAVLTLAAGSGCEDSPAALEVADGSFDGARGGRAGDAAAPRVDSAIDAADAAIDAADAADATVEHHDSASDAGADVLPPEPPRVLLFSKTAGFRHASIDAARRALEEYGAVRNWSVVATEDASVLASALATLDVVVFLMTTGDVLDAGQQTALEAFIRAGGGWVGVHSAADTEYDWPFYAELLGVHYLSHPDVMPATLLVERKGAKATRALVDRWSRTDEWYGFRSNPRQKVIPLLSIDEASYTPGGSNMNGDHPLAWYRGYAGGRAFYTALGHTVESWSEPGLVTHVAGGIEWAAGQPAAGTLVAEFDGAEPNGVWTAAPSGTPLVLDKDRARLPMSQAASRLWVREGVVLNPDLTFAVEALLSLESGAAAGIGRHEPANGRGWAVRLRRPSSGAGAVEILELTPTERVIVTSPLPSLASDGEHAVTLHVAPQRVSVTVRRAGFVVGELGQDLPAAQSAGQLAIHGAGGAAVLRALHAYVP